MILVMHNNTHGLTCVNDKADLFPLPPTVPFYAPFIVYHTHALNTLMPPPPHRFFLSFQYPTIGGKGHSMPILHALCHHGFRFAGFLFFKMVFL